MKTEFEKMRSQELYDFSDLEIFSELQLCFARRRLYHFFCVNLPHYK